MISRFFRNLVHVLRCVFKNLIHWPDRETLLLTMPMCFFNFNKYISSVIDCLEIFIASPSAKDACAETWSSYKHHKTGKIMVSMTPQASISFVSECWGGRTSGKHLTEHCGFLEKLNPGDYVMADRGFTISDALESVKAHLVIPSITKGNYFIEC